MRILLVEDNEALKTQVAADLARARYVVETAPDGTEALYLGENEPFDAIVLDLGLPGLDGLEVLQRWRTAGIATPVIILTCRDTWREKVTGNKVLVTYQRLKTTLEREPYLLGHDDAAGRMWLTRLRSGRHGLEVNTGRFQGLGQRPRDQRFCGWCTKHNADSVVEDERHVVLECPHSRAPL